MDNPAVWAEIDQLRHLKAAALRVKYQELFGAETRSSNTQFLFRRIAWRLQARAEGDLSERARRRASEIADDTELRLRAPRDFAARLRAQSVQPPAGARRQRDSRLPPAGAILSRVYRGQSVVVHVRDDGFEYQGQHYRSLSAIARQATGTRWNGLAFFRLTERRCG